MNGIYALEAIENTHKIAERCHVEIVFGEYKLPRFDVPLGYNAWEYLQKLPSFITKININIWHCKSFWI